MGKNNHVPTVKLDKTDRRLLHELDVNSRQSNIQLGKKLRISKDTVKYRINRLMEKGVITGFYTEIDAYRLGYFSFRILVRFHNITVEKEKQIIKELVENPTVAWVHSGEGNWDLLVGFWVKDIFEVYRKQEEFLNRFGNYIENKLISIYHRMYQFNKDYLTGKRSITAQRYMGGEKTAKLDPLDMKLLKLLVNNGRMAAFEVANTLNTSPKTVSYRIKRLVKEGVITAFRPMIALEVLGRSWYKVHLRLKNIDREKRRKLFTFVSSLPTTMYVDEMIGGYDFEMDSDLESHAQLRSLVESIRDSFPEIVKDFELMDFYKAHKTLAWFPV